MLQPSLASTVLLLLLLVGNPASYHQAEAVPIANQDSTGSSTREPISLEEAFLGELRPKDFGFDWLSSEGTDPDKDVGDQLIYEDYRNILLLTLPSIERRNGSNSSGPAARLQSPPSGFQPNVTLLVSNSSILASIEYQGYKISPSKRYLLLWNLRRKQFRHSSTATYFLYDIQQDMITLLSTEANATSNSRSDGDSEGTESDPSRFQVAEWYSKRTPDGGPPVESLILIQDNDIYNLHDVSRLAKSSDVNLQQPLPVPVRLTTTGKQSVMFNGVPDWLYEEEILGDTPAFQVSPMADHLAYMSFNDSQVNVMPYTVYGERIVPHVEQIRYPKTGQPNPRVSVHIVENISTLSAANSSIRNIRMTLPEDLARQQHYINRITWLTNEKLALIWSNRNQNNSYVVICSQLNGTWTCEKNLNVRADNGWLDISDDLLPLDANHYLALLPKFEGPDVGEFKHIARVSLTSPNTFVFLTGGRRDVIMFNGVDYKRSLVYYTSTVVDEPGQRQLFVAELESTSKEPLRTNVPQLSSSSVCVTCDHHPESCLYNYARMSPSTNYYVFHCAGPDVPRTELRATRRRRHRNFQENLVVNDLTRQSKLLNETQAAPSTEQQPPSHIDESTSNGQSSLLWTLEDNRELRDKLENHRMLPLTIRTKVHIANTNYTANVLLLLPPIDGTPRPEPITPELYASLLPNGQQLPMVVDVYGGPGSQKVDYRFSMYFGHYMASSRRTIYAMIDGRGSGYQGTKRLYELYHRLGTVEIQDQIDVTSRLANSLPFIDPARVAIWGWSYGGYAAAMSLAQSKMRATQELQSYIKAVAGKQAEQQSSMSGPLPRSVFKCAASVAPVTNWIYYDTAYTEKFMSSPWVNEQYDELELGDHSPSNRSTVDVGTNSHFQTNKWTPLNQTLGSPHIKPRLVRSQQLPDLLAKLDINATLAATTSAKSNHRQLSTRTSQTTDLNERYKKASLLEQMVHIDSKHYLLMHGTADDNVHFQQSVMLMKRLIRKNILFRTLFYPDQDHGIANKADKLHLGSTLSDFLNECFSEA